MGGVNIRIGEYQATLAAGKLHEAILDRAVRLPATPIYLSRGQRRRLLNILEMKVRSYSIQLHSFNEVQLAQIVQDIATNLLKTPGQSTLERYSDAEFKSIKAEVRKEQNALEIQLILKGKFNPEGMRTTEEGQRVTALRAQEIFLTNMNGLGREIAGFATEQSMGNRPVLTSSWFRQIFSFRRNNARRQQALGQKIELAFYEALFTASQKRQLSLEKAMNASITENAHYEAAQLLVEKNCNVVTDRNLKTLHGPNLLKGQGVIDAGGTKEEQYKEFLGENLSITKMQIQDLGMARILTEDQVKLLNAKIERIEKVVRKRYEDEFPDQKIQQPSNRASTNLPRAAIIQPRKNPHNAESRGETEGQRMKPYSYSEIYTVLKELTVKTLMQGSPIADTLWSLTMEDICAAARQRQPVGSPFDRQETEFYIDDIKRALVWKKEGKIQSEHQASPPKLWTERTQSGNAQGFPHFL